MLLSGWGRYPRVEARARSFAARQELADQLAPGRECIVHAMGRSYGDSALAERVLLTRRWNCFLEFDPESGVLTCESGASLADVIDAFLPRGWFPAVMPGTRHISVGGAIASDVHGKNHHVAGSFSSCVRSFTLMLPGGEVRRCSTDENPELFRATCGGMGLTGVILTAELALRPVRSALMRQTTVKCRNLDETMEAFAAHGDAEYSVAWTDMLASGENAGRSLLLLGEHAEHGPVRVPRPGMVTVPEFFPGWLLSRPLAHLFNGLKYGMARRDVSETVLPVYPFFFPLDAAGCWNRVYGKRGLTQYQFVLPPEAGREGLRGIMRRIRESGETCYLAVLKLFGPGNANPLSFPRQGWTLALDFRVTPALLALLDELDQMVMERGGRLYLAKDARMRPGMMEAGYPSLGQFRKVRKRYGLMETMQSLQSKRLGI